jgi:hypothetical protein
MKVSLPCSNTKRYLTGMDWVIGALSNISRRSTGRTNDSQIVLELDGPFDDGRFRLAVADFVRLFPVLGGTVARDWNLSPYWKMPHPSFALSVPVETETVSEPDLFQALARSANVRFSSKRQHLAFHVFHTGERRHFVAMHFDHRLFDARGAETFLELFHRWYRGEDCGARLAQIALTESAHLCEWKRKFMAGKLLGRTLRGFMETIPVLFPRPLPLKGRGSRFALVEFGDRDSQAITDRAYREAGFLMFMPYALAAVVQSMDAVRKRNGVSGQDYLVSVSVDTRTPDTAAAKLFFNHVSFMFFRIPVAVAGNRGQTIDAVRTQMYEQIKSKLPQAIAESSLLMRILPLSVLSRLMMRPLHGEFASLGFACVGKGGYACSEFMEARAANLFHMPLVPVPPGLGFVVNQFGNRINAVLSYMDGMLSDEDVRTIQDDLRRGL